MSIYGYGRASTKGQVLTESGQLESVNKYIRNQLPDQQLDEWFYDPATSGGTELFEREAGRRLYYTLQPGDYLIFQRLDRMFRSGLDGVKSLAMLKAKGVTTAIATMPGLDPSSPFGVAMSFAQLGMGQMEKLLIGERTSIAMTQLKSSGKAVNRHAPIGWAKRGKDFVPDMVEREQVEELVKLLDQGNSLRRVEYLVCKMRRTRGCRWSKDSIRKAVIARQQGYPKFPSGYQSLQANDA